LPEGNGAWPNGTLEARTPQSRTHGIARGARASIVVAVVLLTAPSSAVAQGSSPQESSAFGGLAPLAPPAAPAQQPQQTQPQPQSQVPIPEARDEMLGTGEVLVFVGIEMLLLGALGVTIARDGGGGGHAPRARHARRTRRRRRKRGETHSRAGARVPPPPPRKRRAKAGRRQRQVA
jgi:hypothetical protein